MKAFLGFILGLIIGGAAIWIYQSNRANATLVSARNPTDQTATPTTAAPTDDQRQKLRLDAADIKDELSRTGKVIRDKAQEVGQKISDATADARITAEIKGKMIAERDLPSMGISVNTTRGVVTLSGSVKNVDDIGKAMFVALNTDGVTQVISTIQVKPTT